MGIHLLCCTHNNEHIGTSDAICNTFAAITEDVSFHMGWEQLHAFFSITFNSFHQRIDTVLIKDDIHTLANIVITDPTRVDLFPSSCTIQGFGISFVAQIKKKTYHN